MTTGPTLNFARAAEAVTCSSGTLRRRLYEGKLEGAAKDEDTGRWSIPISSLVGAGLMPATTSSGMSEDEERDSEVTRLREQNLKLLHRADMAEAISNERGLALDDVRLALDEARRALAAGPQPITALSETPAVAVGVPIASPTPTEPKQGWVARRLRRLL